MTVTATARPTGQPGYSETLARVAESAKTARSLVRAALDAWGLEQLAEDGALVVSELVANAVEHARGPSIRVTVTRLTADRVRIAVTDKSTSHPTPRTADAVDENGRGLSVIAALADTSGVGPFRWGKRAWAELCRT